STRPSAPAPHGRTLRSRGDHAVNGPAARPAGGRASADGATPARRSRSTSAARGRPRSGSDRRAEMFVTAALEKSIERHRLVLAARIIDNQPMEVPLGEQSLAAAGARSLLTQLDRVLEREAGVRAGEESEHVHRMRVATR